MDVSLASVLDKLFRVDLFQVFHQWLIIRLQFGQLAPEIHNLCAQGLNDLFSALNNFGIIRLQLFLIFRESVQLPPR